MRREPVDRDERLRPQDELAGDAALATNSPDQWRGAISDLVAPQRANLGMRESAVEAEQHHQPHLIGGMTIERHQFTDFPHVDAIAEVGNLIICAKALDVDAKGLLSVNRSG